MKLRIGIACYAVLALVLALASSSPAAAATGYAGGVPWQTGDIVACFGTSSGFGGACNVLRIVNGTAVLLDQFTDSLGGDTFGVAINNTLHVVATEDVGGSKVVVYSVASLNPNTSLASPIAHTPVYTYDSTASNTSSNAKAVAFNNAGDIFVLNSTGPGGSPEIVELGPGPSQSAPFPMTFSLSGCGINQATSMDLSAAGDAAYVTSGSTIQKFTFATNTCSKFADFGTAVTLSGIKDIPAKALPITCGSAITPSFSCPTDEAILVTATGNTDPNETGEVGDSSDAVNICTNTVNGSTTSCALLLDTQPPANSLTAPLWKAATLYPSQANTNVILDPELQLQTVLTAGTSGNEEPNFSDNGGITRDNAVIWTDQGQMLWGSTKGAPPTAYSLNDIVIDPSFHVQQVTTQGESGDTQPVWQDSAQPPFVAMTIDGMRWADQGAAPFPWQPNTTYSTVGQHVVDPTARVQTVATLYGPGGTTGTSGPAAAALWFTDTGNNAIGTISVSGSINEFLIPTGGSQPQAVTGGPDGNIWFTEFSSNKIGRVTPTGTFTEFPLGATFSGLQGITAGPDGNIWFVEINTKKVGNITPGGSNTITEFLISNGLWFGITTGPDGNLWFPEFGFTGRLTPTGNLTEFPGGGGVGITSGPDGNLWITGTNNNTIIQVTPAGLTSYFNIPTPNSQPKGITAGPDGNLWFTENSGNKIGRITPDGTTITEFPVQTLNAYLWGITTGPDGNLWFTEPSGNKIGRITPTGVITEFPGPSGGSPFGITTAPLSPAQPFSRWNETTGENTTDGLTWMNMGAPVGTPPPSWTAGKQYFTVGVQVLDNNAATCSPVGCVEQVVTPGTSTPAAAQPANGWNATVGGTTFDNSVQWTDTGGWTAGTRYFAGNLVGDTNLHLWKVAVGGFSSIAPPDFIHNELPGPGFVYENNAVVWTDRGNWQKNTHYGLNAMVGDMNFHLQRVVASQNAGISGPTMPPFTSDNPAVGQTIDGLQWSNSATTSSVLARYPAPGVTTKVQSLALDPLIVDCTGGCTSPLPALKVSSVITSPGSNPTLGSPGFWLGDSQSANFYKLDFASGTSTTFNANASKTIGTFTACGTCANITGIQGVGIYGSEGANQPGLAKLLFNNTTTSANTETAYYPSKTETNVNSLTLTLYNGSTAATSLGPFAVYGSSVPEPSCFFDVTPSLPCTVTTATGNAIVWKNDIPLPSSGLLKLSSTQTLAYNFDVPPAFQSFNNNVFVDSFYNTTTAVGLDLPGGRYPSAGGIGTPVNANGQPPVDFGCTYQSPAPKCFQNPGTIPVKFVCSKLPGSSLRNFAATIPWGPRLQIAQPAQPPPSPLPIGAAPNQANATILNGGTAPNLGIALTQLPSSNGKITYRFDTSALDWVFNWSVPSTKTKQTYQICTYDDSHNATTFCIGITVASSCSSP